MFVQQIRIKTLAGLCAGAALLTACGGGGDSVVTEPIVVAPAGYPVDAVLTALYTTNNQILSTGFVDPANLDNFYFTTEFSQAGTEVFEGAERQVAQVQTVQRRNGKVMSVGVARTYYSTGPLTVYGQVDDEGNYSVHQLFAALPSKAQLGESGVWYRSTNYTTADKTAVRQLTEVSWTVGATDKADLAWVCLKVVTKETIHPDMTHASSSCIKADHSGHMVDAPPVAAAASASAG